MPILAAWPLAQGCVDWIPTRDAHDRVWMEKMLAGHHGLWMDTGERVPDSAPADERIASNPESARLTRYRLDVGTSRPRMLAGDWYLLGGLVGRAGLAGGETVELFMKEIVRAHWPMHSATVGRDYSFDVFLVVRPAGAPARLVRHWHIPPGDVAAHVPRANEETLRQLPPGAPREPHVHKVFALDGFLTVDPRGPTATVTVTGLTRPFEERVDLTGALRPSP